MAVSDPLLEVDAAHALTLGALLYRDGTKPYVSEGAWVALVAAIAAQNPAALHIIYERTQVFVFTIALRICRNRATAEEVTVDVFHEVWRRAAHYKPIDGTVVGWVMNLTRSRAIDRLRYETRKKRLPPASSGNFEPSVEDPDVIERLEHSARLKAALLGLTEEERNAIELAYFSDSSYAEVARRLDLPLGTIKTRIRSGLTKLRFALAREGNP